MHNSRKVCSKRKVAENEKKFKVLVQSQLLHQIVTNLTYMLEVIDAKIGSIDISKRKQGLDRLLRERAVVKTQI